MKKTLIIIIIFLLFCGCNNTPNEQEKNESTVNSYNDEELKEHGYIVRSEKFKTNIDKEKALLSTDNQHCLQLLNETGDGYIHGDGYGYIVCKDSSIYEWSYTQYSVNNKNTAFLINNETYPKIYDTKQISLDGKVDNTHYDSTLDTTKRYITFDFDMSSYLIYFNEYLLKNDNCIYSIKVEKTSETKTGIQRDDVVYTNYSVVEEELLYTFEDEEIKMISFVTGYNGYPNTLVVLTDKNYYYENVSDNKDNKKIFVKDEYIGGLCDDITLIIGREIILDDGRIITNSNIKDGV